GYYRITVPNNQASLVFTGVGYNPREVKVGGLSTLNITMTADGSAMNEVVVTALGISREKKALTYASQGVASKEINENLQPNVVNALQ
ncbi:hypothetical protein, partial [Salmonella enterica]|uniref:hypothetical protein n=1 Tax=Salmonella enterica TaxID=28901 RepID=UPI0015CC852E